MSKKKPLTVMIDIDGVLADFVLGFTTLGQKYGAVPTKSVDHEQWDVFPGLDASVHTKLWDEISDSNYFWQTLTPLITVLDALQLRLLEGPATQVYYVTNRLGLNVRRQTERWLRVHVGVANPTVIIARSKGDVAKAVMADYAIDDKAENAWCIGWITTPQNSKTPDCRSYLLDRKYNQYDSKVGSSKIRRVASLREFLLDVEEKLGWVNKLSFRTHTQTLR